MNPRVSIVIPMYNSADTVGGTITGALTQTYHNLEIIVVDDGSTDDSHKVAAAYGDRITLITQENAGVSSARNRGAAAATGELLAFCDADDIMLPSYVSAAVDAWKRAGSGRACVYLNGYFLRADGISPLRVLMSAPPPRAPSQRMAILQGNFASSYMVIPAALYDEVGGSDEELRTVEDWDLWMRLIFAGARAVPVLRPQVLYRWTSGSLSANSDQMLAGERLLFEKLRASLTTLSPREHEYVTRRLATDSPRELRFRADAAIDRGDYAAAAAAYRTAAELTPRDLKLQARRWTVGMIPSLGRIWRARQKDSGRLN